MKLLLILLFSATAAFGQKPDWNKAVEQQAAYFKDVDIICVHDDTGYLKEQSFILGMNAAYDVLDTLGKKPGKIIVRQNINKQWYALIVASNGKVIFKSSEYYRNRKNLYKAIEALRNLNLKTIIEE